MNSMTGYGRAEIKSKLGRLTVDLSSVNSRFLDFTYRAPKSLQPLELQVRQLVTSRLSRGKINVNLGLDESSASDEGLGFDASLFEAHYRKLEKARVKLKISTPLTMSDILTMPGTTDTNNVVPSTEMLTKLWTAVEPAVGKALAQLISMRKREGAQMAKDMRAILKPFPAQIEAIKEKTTVSVDHYRQKLSERIAEILDSNQVSRDKLEEEVAFFAERSDVTEEFLRLASHIDEFLLTIKLDEPVGKRLNFILQEMNREVNTIGSKCSEFSITTAVIKLKEETEKLREMVQNAE